MKPIKTEFSAEGHYLRQIWREGDVAVYERSLSVGKSPHELEMVTVRQLGDKTMPDGKISLAHEIYPSASEWGKFGWSFPIWQKAWVLDLAAQSSLILEGRSAFVRKAVHDKWVAEHPGR